MLYWGRYYRTEMIPLLMRIDTYLGRWARRSTGGCEGTLSRVS